MMRVDEITLLRLGIPLRVPYKLAFGAVTGFDTILARAVVDGSIGWGEATILTGYTDETIEESWGLAQRIAAAMPGASCEAAMAVADERLAAAPFTRTALVTAVEMAMRHPLLAVAHETSVPILAGLNATEPPAIEREIEAHLAAGYHTLKVKVGFDVEADLGRVRFIQQRNAGRARLRIDANQGYSRDGGCGFASRLDPADIELLEQPCAAEDWEAAEAVARVTAVPLMLDESIYDETDIERAARLGASFVKLKLMKLGSLDRLDRALALIRELGMEPVLGNGVASEVGCWMEACVARHHLRNAGEMNGFLRQAAPLAAPPLPASSGAIRMPPGFAPRLDPAALAAVTLAEAHFDRVVQAAQ
jgi:L-alanine-DL-glutamate epimerase-like enolase superfamily enzyme